MSGIRDGSRTVIAGLVGLCVGLCLCVAARAQEEALGLEQARSQFANGDFQGAYASYLALFREAPTNLDVNFELGRAAFEAGDSEAAVLAFERVIMLDATHDRARLELARAYFQLGVLPVARSYFQEVLAKDPPEEVKRNINLFLAEIDAREKHSNLAGTLDIGINWDTNARVSPSSTAVDVPGLGTVTVDDEISDEFLSVTLGAVHTYRRPGSALGWKTAGLAYNAFYRDETDLRLNYVSVSTGPSYQSGRWMADLMLAGEYMEKQSEVFLRGISGQCSGMMALTDTVYLTAAAQVSRREYLQDPEREALQLQLLAGPSAVWGDNRLMARVGWEEEDAWGAADWEEDQFSYTNLFGYIRYERRLPWDISAYASYRYEHIDYESDYATFADDRLDRVHELTGGITKLIRENISVELIHTYTKTDSTLELYEYTRNLTSLLLSVSF